MPVPVASPPPTEMSVSVLGRTLSGIFVKYLFERFRNPPKVVVVVVVVATDVIRILRIVVVIVFVRILVTIS